MTDNPMRYGSQQRRTMASQTFSRQSEVPRLPLPKVEDTIRKFLVTCEPYARSKEEMDSLRKAAEDFLKDPDTQRRQRALEKLRDDNPNGSWLEDMWMDGYLAWGVSLVVNSNVTGWLYGKHRVQAPQAFSAAAMTLGLLRYHLDLVEGVVPVNLAKDKPQCMDQYSRMFELNREPGDPKDKLTKYAGVQHITVTAGHRLYKVQVLGDDKRTMIPLATLVQRYQQILDDAWTRGPAPFSVCSLTGGERAKWAHARNHLLTLGNNKQALREVESGIFAMSLEPGVDVADREVAVGALHGDGRSRWFDKSFTGVVKADGNLSIHIEHSWADAPVPLDGWFNHAMPFAEQQIAALKRGEAFVAKPSDEGKWPAASEIVFELDDRAKRAIRDTEKFLDDVMRDSSVEAVHCTGLGKAVWKQAGISPDAAVQMAMQVAYRRLHGGEGPVATYETIGMAGWLHGRTECCRVVSNDSERFVQAMLNGYLRTRTEDDRVVAEKALRAAADAHIKYISEGQQGKGVDRHLLGLRSQSLPNQPVPALFQHPLFSRSGTTGSFVLSTSNNSYIPRPFGGLFGSGLADGYGVAYVIRDDEVTLGIECKRSSKVTRGDALRFGKMVNDALMDVATVAGVALPRAML